MKTKISLFIAVSILILLMAACSTGTDNKKGKLFIIGGGAKSTAMMKELVDLSGIRKDGYLFILPMASIVPDSSLIWTREDFDSTGIASTPGFNFIRGETPPPDKLDSLRNAKLIFISGGDQERFMECVRNTPIMDAILSARSKGAVIAGTSAGAAVMSDKMITGNQLRHPGLESAYPTIESANIEIRKGLGFLTNAIIDQHFTRRQRLNRLISVSIENPDETCIGIDESTAIVVDGNQALVTGLGQVVVIRNDADNKQVRGNLLGAQKLELFIYTPGDSFMIK
jgi:cyanophycinase